MQDKVILFILTLGFLCMSVAHLAVWRHPYKNGWTVAGVVFFAIVAILFVLNFLGLANA